MSFLSNTLLMPLKIASRHGYVRIVYKFVTWKLSNAWDVRGGSEIEQVQHAWRNTPRNLDLNDV